MPTNIIPLNRATCPDPSGQSSILIEYDLFENLLITIKPPNAAQEVYSLLTFEDEYQGLMCFRRQKKDWRFQHNFPFTLLELVNALDKTAYKPQFQFQIDIETAEFIKHLGLEADLDAYNFFHSVKHWQYFDYPKIYMLIVFFNRENLTHVLKKQDFTTDTINTALGKKLSRSKLKSLRKLKDDVPNETLLKAAEIIIFKSTLDNFDEYIKYTKVRNLIEHQTTIYPLSLIEYLELYDQYPILENISWIKLGTYTKDSFQRTYRLLRETYHLGQLLGKRECFWSFCYSTKSEADIIKRNIKWSKELKKIEHELPSEAFQKFPETELKDNEYFKHISNSKILEKTARLLNNCAFDLRIQCFFHSIELFQYLAANGKCLGLIEIEIEIIPGENKRYFLGEFLGYENRDMSELDKAKLEQWINFQTVMIN